MSESFWTQLLDVFDRIDLLYLIPFLAFVALHFLAEPLRWKIYLGGWRRTPYGLLLNIFNLTGFLSYTLPLKMGIPVRIFLLNKHLGLQLTSIAGVLALDGLIYYGGWAVAALGGFYLLVDLNIFSKGQLSVMRLIPVVLVLAVLAFLARKRLIAMLFRLPGIARLADRLSQALAIIDQIDWPRLLFAAAIVATDIASNVLRHWALLAMFGYHLPWNSLFVITTVSVFAGMASLMPAGLGGYDAVLIFLLVKSSVPLEIAILVAVCNRIGTILISAVLGISAGLQLDLNLFKRDWDNAAAK